MNNSARINVGHMTSPWRIFTLFLGISLLFLLAFAESMMAGQNVFEKILVTMFAIPVIWLLVRVGRSVLTGIDRRDLFSPWVLFPGIYIVWFVVGSIDFLQIPSTISFGAFDPIPARMWFYYAVGLLSYFLGTYFTRPSSIGLESVQLGFEPSLEWREDKFKIGMVVLFGFMLVSYAVIVSQIGIPVLQPDTYLVRLEIGKQRWAQLVLITGGYSLIPVLSAYLWRTKRIREARIMFWSIVFLSGLILLSLGSRGFIFQPLLTAAVARHYLRARYKLVRFGFVLLLIFASMSLYGYVRENEGPVSESTIVAGGFPSYLFPFAYSYLYIRYSVSTFRDIVSIVPSQVAYQHGWLTFQPLQIFLPGHHSSSDTFFKSILGSDFEGAGQPATLLGPFYADFGLLGIVVGMIGFGALSTFVYRWMLSRQTVTSVLVYAWIVKIAIFSLFLSVFEFPSDLWIPVCWLLLDRFLRGGRKELVFHPPGLTPSASGAAGELT
jgi:oligosaccharide repeat unit polymerase